MTLSQETLDLNSIFCSKEYTAFDCSSLVRSVEEEAVSNGLLYLQIKVRRDELLDVLLNGKPWEDLLIGFQCRIYRMPNIYNSNFWFYFTNIYIGNKVISSTQNQKFSKKADVTERDKGIPCF